MAWIESHQTVWSHAKTRKAARKLDVSDVQVVGHLHSLWHWALDHAEDGNLSKYDAEDLAIASRWDGDPDEFIDALTTCGPGDSAGYLERGGEYGPPGAGLTGELVLHDWWDYAGKLIAQRMTSREAGAHGNHVRYGTHDPDCPRCSGGEQGGDSGGEQGGDGDGTRDPIGSGSHLTEPNLTNQPEPTSGGESDADDPPGEDEASRQFEEHFWPIYPPRNGKKRSKGKALIQWRKLTLEERRRALAGARNLARSGELPKDAHRFLRADTAGEYPFDDWQTPARTDGVGPTPPGREACDRCGAYSDKHVAYCPRYEREAV